VVEFGKSRGKVTQHYVLPDVMQWEVPSKPRVLFLLTLGSESNLEEIHTSTIWGIMWDSQTGLPKGVSVLKNREVVGRGELRGEYFILTNAVHEP